MVLGRIGVPEDIPEVTCSRGMAPGAPVMVLGGWEVIVAGIELEIPEILGLTGMTGLTELDGLRGGILGLVTCL